MQNNSHRNVEKVPSPDPIRPGRPKTFFSRIGSSTPFDYYNYLFIWHLNQNQGSRRLKNKSFPLFGRIGLNLYFCRPANPVAACIGYWKLKSCPDGGIGRRAGLKHLCLHWHAGSTPAPGT